MGDTDLAAAEHLKKAFEVWGYREVCEKYNIKFFNLAKAKSKKIYLGKYLGYQEIAEILLDSQIITLPIGKTHCLTTITGALKNQWGCVPRVRHQFHPVADYAIPEINKSLNVVFCLMDGTITMEENAPRTGIPKITNFIMASKDRVAIDSALATIFGFDPKKIGHIVNSAKEGLGNIEFQILGDKKDFKPFNVLPPNPNRQPIFFWEMLLRRIPILKQILFDTPIFSFLAWMATTYNTRIWFKKKGLTYVKAIWKYTEYGEVYKELFLKNYKIEDLERL